MESVIIESCENKDIHSLFEDYMSHMCQFSEIEDYEAWVGVALGYLNSYAIDSDRHIFALKLSGVPIGFAMVNSHLRFNEDGFAIAEFYVDKQHQGKGYGRELAEYVFSQFPGRWEVAVIRGNTNAQSFWRRIISSCIGGECREWSIESYDGAGFSFDNA